jgi:hypothetical protein
MSQTTTTATFDEFAAIFHAEHRTVRDLLLNLVSAFERRDLAEVNALLSETAAVAGPHFR